MGNHNQKGRNNLSKVIQLIRGTGLRLEAPKTCWVFCAVGNRASQNQTVVRFYSDTYIE